MIWESGPWKRDLLKDADVIERWAKKGTGSARREILLEKKIFLSAYVMRRLIECFKLTDRCVEQSVPCQILPARGTEVDIMNNHKVEEHFDFSSARSADIKIKPLANQIIHSLVFAFEISGGEYSSPVIGFFVASDWGKERGLYQVSLDDYLSTMRMVGSDYPMERHAVKTENGWEISQR